MRGRPRPPEPGDPEQLAPGDRVVASRLPLAGDLVGLAFHHGEANIDTPFVWATLEEPVLVVAVLPARHNTMSVGLAVDGRVMWALRRVLRKV